MNRNIISILIRRRPFWLLPLEIYFEQTTFRCEDYQVLWSERVIQVDSLRFEVARSRSPWGQAKMLWVMECDGFYLESLQKQTQYLDLLRKVNNDEVFIDEIAEELTVRSDRIETDSPLRLCALTLPRCPECFTAISSDQTVVAQVARKSRREAEKRN